LSIRNTILGISQAKVYDKKLGEEFSIYVFNVRELLLNNLGSRISRKIRSLNFKILKETYFNLIKIENIIMT